MHCMGRSRLIPSSANVNVLEPKKSLGIFHCFTFTSTKVITSKGFVSLLYIRRSIDNIDNLYLLIRNRNQQTIFQAANHSDFKHELTRSVHVSIGCAYQREYLMYPATLLPTRKPFLQLLLTHQDMPRL